jgi:hypothetical protein
MKPIIYFIISITFIQSLTGQNNLESQLININILKSLNEKKTVQLSRFVEGVTYIPIETNPEILLAGDAEFDVTDEYIIVRNGKRDMKYQILLFDRKTGKFIREIGKQGRGPDEYQVYSYIPFNSDKREIYALGPSRQILVYDLSGKIIDRISPPIWKDIGIPANDEIFNHFQTIYVQYYNTLDPNIFVGYVRNNSGMEKRKVVLFSKNGYLKVFPNHLIYKREDWRQFWQPPGQFAKFYKWNNELNFIEAFCDTLYRITKDRLIPRYYFNFGRFNPPYSRQPDIMLEKHWYEYFFIIKICENQDYIFFTFDLKKETYLAFIEKGTKNVTICKIGSSGISALKDDINGLMDVIPQSFTINNEMIYVIKPSELINWLKENPHNSNLFRQSQPWLKEFNEFSNPIIAIAKCKD